VRARRDADQSKEPSGRRRTISDVALALLKRFPNPRYRPKPWRWLPEAGDPKYAALSDDLAAVHEDLMPAFKTADFAALRAQNRFRGAQVTLILGGAVIAILGSLQAALGDTVTWPSVAQLVVGGALTAVGTMQTRLGSQQRYLRQRLVAERLRSEAFLFLGRINYPADPAAARTKLVARVKEIREAPGQ
jgi:acyl dehydratase